MTKRIFVIDDDSDHAESLADLLAMRGHSVEIAHSGEEAVERFRTAAFDLVLMDVKLPGMNGVETFFEFRRVRPDARVMMMTGYSVEQLVSEAVAHGALGVLHKPFDGAQLIAVVDSVPPKGLVLVADDDPEIAERIPPILEAHGWRVEVARTGQEALDMAADAEYDCVLLNLQMPVLSGLEVYMQLKALGRISPTILIASRPDEAEPSCVAAAQGLLVKPIDAASLLDAIARLAPA